MEHRDFTMVTLSLGAGVQSSTMAEMVVEGDLPPVDYAIFADTGDEPKLVYQQVWYLARRLSKVGVPLIVVSAGDMVEDIYGGGRFAALPLFTVTKEQVEGFGIVAEEEQVGRLRRQCTREYKVEPIERFIRQTLLAQGKARRYSNGAIHVNKGVKACSWLGITTDEAERMKPNRTTWITNRWPLIDKKMSRQDCIDWLVEHHLPIAPKSSCKRCPYHDDNYWLEMKEERPAEWREVVQFDRDLRNDDSRIRLKATAKGDLYLHRQCIPLDEIDLQPAPQMSFGFCDEGYCWT